MKLNGKQFENSTIEQDKLHIETNTIVNLSSVTNVDYVKQETYERIDDITFSTLNNNMTANNATIGDKACDDFIIEFPISTVVVKVNGVNVSVGSTKDCYFKSSDGLITRDGGYAEKGDYLYWNSNKYDLDTNDDISFVFITMTEEIALSANTNVTLDPYYPSLNIKYTGANNTSMVVTIDGVDFTVGNVNGDFVWDIGGSNETTLTVIGDSVIQDVNGEDYTIWFDGFGSLLFSLKKGNFVLFSATHDEKSRVKLYKKILKPIQKMLGFSKSQTVEGFFDTFYIIYD